MRTAVHEDTSRPSLVLALLLLTAPAAFAQLPSYTGGTYGNAAVAHDSRLRWAVGVQNVQVVRSAPGNPGATDGSATFYRHHVDMVYWNGQFWSSHWGEPMRLNWSTNGLDWGPTSASTFMPGGGPRMAFYVASNGRLLGSGWAGDNHLGGARLVREIYGPNSYGTVYNIKTNYLGPDPYSTWPYYTASTSSGFKTACNALRDDPLYRQQWQEEDEDDPGFYTVNLNTIPGVTEWKAFNWYRLPDNRIVGAWKGAPGSRNIYLAASTGTNWNIGNVPTPVPQSTFKFKDNAKTWGTRTEDGRYAMIGCLDLTRRWPLAVTTSADGWTFDTPYLVIAGDMPMQRYEDSLASYGDSKNTGEQYVRGLSPGNGDPPGTDLWLTYSMHKEDIWVASVPTPITGTVTNDVHDDFQSHALGRRVAGWNTYSPQWAPVAIAAEGTNRFVRLEDRDPCDYASVTRVFPQSRLARLAFQVRAHQTNTTSEPLEIDVVSGNGTRAVALALNPTNGQITAFNGATRQNLRAYSTNAWISVELSVDADRSVYDLKLDGVTLLAGAAFLESPPSVERVTFRTGAFRLRDFTRRPDDNGMPDRIPGADVVQPTSRFDLDNVALEQRTPFLIASIDSVSSGRVYLSGTAQSGALIYMDRTIVIQSLPPELAGLEMIRTSQNDASVTATNHLRFTVSRPAAVYVAFDRDAPRLPAWLAGWTDTGLQILSDFAGGFRVYRKSFGAGQVILGGNEGGYTGAVSSYFVLAAPNVALVTVNAGETWDGVSNPHANDGVTLSGVGTEAEPFTYTIPRGMHVTSTGTINLCPPGNPNDYSIKFVIAGGDLQMDAGAALNLERYQIRTGRQVFVLDLSGTNSITGAGRIGPVTASTSTPRVLTITNVNHVQLTNIDLSVRDVNNQGRHLNITANGTVEVTGKIDNSDQDSGGEGSWDVNVFAREIKVKDVDTRCLRTGTGTRTTGKINLKALAPPGYNPTDGANNTAANRITIRGLLVATNNWTSDLYGQITSETVILQLESGADLKTAANKLTLNAGKVRADATAGHLFVNQSGDPYTPAYVVDWSGTIAPARPTIWFGAASAGQVSLHWSGIGFVLQQNPDLSNPGGWINAPPGTNMPAVVSLGGSNLFYRLKWPQ